MALRSPDMVGALANLRGDLLLDVNEEDVAQVCNTAGMEAQCAHMSYMLRSTGFAARLLLLRCWCSLCWPGVCGGRRAAFWGTMVIQGGSALLAIAHLVVVRASVSGFDAVAESPGDERGRCAFRPPHHPDCGSVDPAAPGGGEPPTLHGESGRWHIHRSSGPDWVWF